MRKEKMLKIRFSGMENWISIPSSSRAYKNITVHESPTGKRRKFQILLQFIFYAISLWGLIVKS